jgi:hypothetical protein
MGSIFLMEGKKGVSHKAVVRRKGIFKTKTFRTRARAKHWIKLIEAEIEQRQAADMQPKMHRNAEPAKHVSNVEPAEPPSLTLDARPWLTLEEASALLGMKPSYAKQLVHIENFPVPVERLGRKVIVMKDVMNEFFRNMSERGLKALRERYADGGEKNERRR